MPYGSIYTFSNMVMQAKTEQKRKKLAAEYARLQRQLSRLGYVCHGTVNVRRESRTINGETKILGPYYTWTRKRDQKTVTASISKEQYQWLEKAIKNQRKMDQILHRMQEISRQIVFETLPGVKKRNRLQEND